MTSRFLKQVSVLAVSLSFLGCGGKSDSPSAKAAPQGLLRDFRGQVLDGLVSSTEALSAIDGTYSSECHPEKAGGGVLYTETTFTLKAMGMRKIPMGLGQTLEMPFYQGIELEQRLYADPGCRILVSTGSGFGAFKLNAARNEMTVSYSEMEITPTTAEVAKALNEVQACDLTNWELSVANDLTKTPCNKPDTLQINSLAPDDSRMEITDLSSEEKVPELFTRQ